MKEENMASKLLLAMLIAATSANLVADGYRFIISDNSVNEYSTLSTAPVALNTASLSRAVDATVLDARFRTMRETEPIRLNSFPAVGFLLLLK